MPRLAGPVVLGLGGFVLALLLLVPGLDAYGFWSEGELPILDRTLAALGAALSGLVRSPWLPDAARTQGYAMFEGELGLRLPHALAGAALVAFAIGWARRAGAGLLGSLCAGAFAASFPVLAVGSRTVLGNPIGELMTVVTVAAGLVALRSETVLRAAIWASIAAGALALSIASLGIVLGGTIPLGALAVADHGDRSRKVVPVLWAAALGTLGIGIYLVLGQQDGYIPLLGASQDMELMEKPETRRFAASVEDFGYQVYPWAGLIFVGAVTRRARFAALWLVIAIAVAGGWSLLYGRVPMPMTVPAALCAAAAAEALSDGNRSVWERRLMVFIIAASAVVMRKDAELRPSKIVAPVEVWQGEYSFPDEATAAKERLERLATWAFIAVVIAAIIGRRRSERGLERLLVRIPPRWRDGIAVGVFGAAAVGGAVSLTHGLVPAVARATSPRQALDRYQRWVEAGALPEGLAVHRIRDDGLTYYGPGDIVVLQTRREVAAHLRADEPRAALIRNIDFPPTYQDARQHGWKLYMLDDSHAKLRLVANTLPEGAEDSNPLLGVLFDEDPGLANQTRVQFENYMEIIGWEVDGPLRRGRKHTLRLAIKAHRPLPGGAKLYTRFLHGKLSRINREPVEIADDLYPCNLWREGDYILHEYEFEVPPFETLPGEYEFLIGLRRSERSNFSISVPEGKTGEFGVEVKGSAREFAQIGTVELW